MSLCLFKFFGPSVYAQRTPQPRRVGEPHRSTTKSKWWKDQQPGKSRLVSCITNSTRISKIRHPCVVVVVVVVFLFVVFCLILIIILLVYVQQQERLENSRDDSSKTLTRRRDSLLTVYLLSTFTDLLIRLRKTRNPSNMKEISKLERLGVLFGCSCLP